MSRRDQQKDEGHSAFPATVVFLAIVLVGGTLLFRGHLFETEISAHVYVPMPSAEKVALAKVGLEAHR